MSALDEKRKPARRSRRRFTVYYGAASPKHIGYSGNISSTGMMIRTIRVFEPGTRLLLDVEIGSGKLRLRAQVVWARVGEIRWLPTGKIGMGVKFIDPPKNLMDIISPVAASG